MSLETVTPSPSSSPPPPGTFPLPRAEDLDPVGAGLHRQQIGTAQLNDELQEIGLGGGVNAIDKKEKRDLMTPRQQLEALVDDVDDGIEWGQHRGMGLHEDAGGAPAARVITGTWTISGVPHVVIVNDSTSKAGSFVSSTCQKTIDALRKARELKLPVMCLVDSAGVFLPQQKDVYPGKEGFGTVFEEFAKNNEAGISQRVAIMGSAVAGGAYKVPSAWAGAGMVQHPKVTVGIGSGPLVFAAVEEVVNDDTFGHAAMHYASGVIHHIARNHQELIDWCREDIDNDQHLKTLSTLYKIHPKDAPEDCPRFDMMAAIQRRYQQEKPAAQLDLALRAVGNLIKKKKAASEIPTEAEIQAILAPALTAIETTITSRVVELSVAAMLALQETADDNIVKIRKTATALSQEQEDGTQERVMASSLIETVTDALIKENASLLTLVSAAVARKESGAQRNAIATVMSLLKEDSPFQTLFEENAPSETQEIVSSGIMGTLRIIKRWIKRRNIFQPKNTKKTELKAQLAAAQLKVEGGTAAVIGAATGVASKKIQQLHQTALEKSLRQQLRAAVENAVGRVAKSMASIEPEDIDSLESIVQQLSQAVIDNGRAIFQQELRDALTRAVSIDLAIADSTSLDTQLTEDDLSAEVEHIRTKVTHVLRRKEIEATVVRDYEAVREELTQLGIRIKELNTKLKTVADDERETISGELGKAIMRRNQLQNSIGKSVRDAAQKTKAEVIERLERSRAGEANVEAQSGDILYALPSDPNESYDVRNALECVIDPGTFQEYDPTTGRGLVCGFSNIGGQRCAIIANQGMPTTDADGTKNSKGVINKAQSNKGEAFINHCEQDNTPIIFLHDVNGFQVGTASEGEGLLNDGEGFIHKAMTTSCQTIAIILRSFGAGNYAMKHRADIKLALADSDLCVMSGEAAKSVVKAVGSDKEKAKRDGKALAAQYKIDKTPQANAAAGHHDIIIDPRQAADTIGAFLVLFQQARETDLPKPAPQRIRKPFNGYVLKEVEALLRDSFATEFPSLTQLINGRETQIAQAVSQFSNSVTQKGLQRWMVDWETEAERFYPSSESRFALVKQNMTDGEISGEPTMTELDIRAYLQAPFIEELVRIFDPTLAKKIRVFMNIDHLRTDLDLGIFDKPDTLHLSLDEAIPLVTKLLPVLTKMAEIIDDATDSDLLASVVAYLPEHLETASGILEKAMEE